MTELVAGFALGLAGSGHCALMCGPLMLALHRGSGSAAGSAFAYHQMGRVVVYVIAGALAGSAGHAAGLAGFGRAVAVSTGAVLILGAVPRAGAPGLTRITAAFGRRLSGLTSMVTRRLGHRRRLHAFALGAVNGLLPCGMTYAALASATALGSAAHAMLFMAGFGLGALPALAAWQAVRLPRALVRRLELATRFAVIVIGVSLAAQGLNTEWQLNPWWPASTAFGHHHH
jgi:uncharacterized protein